MERKDPGEERNKERKLKFGGGMEMSRVNWYDFKAGCVSSKICSGVLSTSPMESDQALRRGMAVRAYFRKFY